MTPDGRVEAFDRAVPEALAHKVGIAKLVPIIDSFLAHLPERMQLVRAGLSSGNLGQAADGLHAIGPSARILGALELARIASEMEHLARSGDGAALLARAANLEHAYTEADAALCAYRGRINPPGSS